MVERAIEDERRPLDEVYDRLGRAGVAPGPAGYDVAALNAAIASRGLMPATVEGGADRFRALIPVEVGELPVESCVGVGATPDEALARALDAYIGFMTPEL